MALTPMMLQYLEMHDKVKDSILFFRLGDFYEMFFDDAELVSKELELTLTGKNCGLEERAPMCGVPFHSADSYIAKLVEKGYKVAICEQVEDSASAKGLVDRDIVRIISPGTQIDNEFLNPQANNYIMSLYSDSKGTGCAYLDLSTGDFFVTEFKGKDILDFLLAQISRYEPKEILIHSKFYENTFIIDEIKNRFDSFLQPYPSKFYELSKSEKRLNEQFKTFSTESLGLSGKDQIIRAAGALLNYIDETQRREVSHINQLSFSETNKVMSLDSASIRNLELTKTLRSGSKRGSLLGILDKTVTAAGSRLMTNLIEAPLIDKNEIEKRLDRTEEILNDIETSEQIRERLENIYDFERICSKIIYSKVVPADLISLKQSIFAYSQLIKIIGQSNLENLKEDFKDADELKDIFTLLEESIEENQETKRFGKVHKIKRGYNKKLDSYRTASENGEKWLEKLEEKEKEQTHITNLKVKYNKVFGYFLEVPNGKKNLVPQRYIRKQTLSNSERYFTPELKKLEEKINEAQEGMEKLENELYSQVLDIVKEEIQRIQKAAKLCSKLDVFRALAQVAKEYDYVRPEITDTNEIFIENGRHPVVEQFTGRNYFISNTTDLDDQVRFMLITGPNMAGKSTYIRQTALIVLMAQIGSFVPAKSAKIGIVDRIFTRVGASDNLATGQSTFMVEMSEVSNILKNATENSLVILDEIGRGTSTYDGVSLAWAITEELTKRKTKTLFATHYHELTELEEKVKGLKNYCIDVLEKEDGVVFLRKIKEGRANQSYGIEVARLAGFPEKVLNRAKQILDDLESGNSKEFEKYFQDSGQLSIFSLPKNEKKEDKKEKSPVLEYLNSLDPDSLSPREAQNELYKLKELLNEN